jgi:hypothetical protein
MDRRSFLRSLVGIPFLALLRPEAVEAESTEVELVPADGFVYPQEPDGATSWTGAEFSSLAVGPDDTLYIGGAFVSDDYLSRWNGREFEPVEFIEGAIVKWDTVL